MLQCSKRFPVCFKKVVNSAAQVVFAAGQREFRLRRLSSVCVCVCVCVCMYFVCCKYMAHKHHVEHIFSCFYREIYSKSCYSLSKKCSRFVFSVLFESLHSKATSLISPIIPILSFPTQKRKKEEKICTLYVSLSHVFLTPYPLFALSAWVRWPCPTPQPVASGRVAFQSCGGSGVFLQLGNIGILSCLHKLLSGRR